MSFSPINSDFSSLYPKLCLTLHPFYDYNLKIGKIYEVEGRPESVVKIFHNTSKSATNRQKLQAMLLNKPKFDPVKVNGVDFIQIAWPEALLDDDKGFCVGYMMPLIDMNKAVSLDHLMQKAIRKKLNLSEKYAIFVTISIFAMCLQQFKSFE